MIAIAIAAVGTTDASHSGFFSLLLVLMLFVVVAGVVVGT